ncbi:hypothetical protein COU53_02105 [Candidatus Pacearchaeota archaeon CG10_big_fil_rev_8_21_14_0_10_30_48]|nr:MAG: hypothetical protein COU53_02105 [Candidatus Pacearchaeota archaeon CG10_big_fil_rev_8_21_14_0_10_30_48]
MVNKKDTINISKKNLIIISIILAVVIIGIILYSQNPSIFKQDKVVATVNGESIKQSSIDSIKEYALSQDKQITDEQAIEQAISQELLKQKAEDEGYSITLEETETELSSQISQTGTTLEELKATLKSEGSSYEEAIVSYQSKLEIEKYLNETLKIPKIDESEAKAFYDENKEGLGGDKAPKYEDMKDQITSYLTLVEQQKEIAKIIVDLKSEAKIEYK